MGSSQPGDDATRRVRDAKNPRTRDDSGGTNTNSITATSNQGTPRSVSGSSEQLAAQKAKHNDTTPDLPPCFRI